MSDQINEELRQENAILKEENEKFRRKIESYLEWKEWLFVKVKYLIEDSEYLHNNLLDLKSII